MMIRPLFYDHIIVVRGRCVALAAMLGFNFETGNEPPSEQNV
jgi:hypothetical protein